VLNVARSNVKWGPTKMRREIPLVVLVLFFQTILLAQFATPVEANTTLNVLSQTGYLASAGQYLVVGETQNVGNQAVHMVNMTVSFYNASDNLIWIGHGGFMLDTINPGCKSPFMCLINSEILASQVNHYSVEISSFEPTNPKPVGLRIVTNSSYIDEYGDMVINGTIKNTGTTTASMLTIWATYYDTHGNVTDVREEALTVSLYPNLTFPFEIKLYEPNRVPSITSYELTAESYEYASIPEFPSAALWLLVMVCALVAVAKKKNAHHVLA